MCSNTEDLDELEGSESSERLISLPQPNCGIIEAGGICKKCNCQVDKLYQLSFRAAECRDCFLIYVRHKFRATLGSSKLLRRDETVLIVFDGSPEAIMMVDMMHYALTQNSYKRLHCTAKILFIDESHMSEEYSQGPNLDNVKEFLMNYEIFESYVVPINVDKDEPIHLNRLSDAMPVNSEIPQSKGFHLEDIKSLTSRQDYLYEYRKRIILTVAGQLKCKYAFLSDTSVKLAARLMSSVALGRGGSAALDVALVDQRGHSLYGVKLVRPLKDVNSNEVQLYLQVQHLTEQEIIFRRCPYGSYHGANTSVQNLTNTFIENLQSNFSSTVSTVYRTGDKIATNDDSSSDQHINLPMDYANKMVADKCNLCLGNLDFSNSNTLLAIEYSRLTSKNGIALTGNPNLEAAVYDNVLGEGKNKQWSRLCHGCRNIHMDVSDENIIL